MNVSRRNMLKSTAVAAVTLPLFGCERATSSAAKWLGEDIPFQETVATGSDIDAQFHLLSRATYGLWPGDLDRIKKMGTAQWLAEQLNPETIDDQACEIRSRRFETLWLDTGTCFEYKRSVLRDELCRHMLTRAIYSKRQLYEVMVGFWSDHLNIDVEKGDAIYAKATDDRKVIRPHALGKFRQLIAASATSAAMLIYLDGKENRKPTSASVPNENYARELLELHTLGVDGGYTQKDIFEVARCLTGWTIHTPWQRGLVYFDQSQHDNGAKEIFGYHIEAGGGEKDLDAVLAILCEHPSTASHIAKKLVTHFVSEIPPQTLVASVADTFTRTDGDIKAMLSEIFSSEEFTKHPAAKIKRPFHFIASSLRTLAGDTYGHGLTEYLNRMGQTPFQYPTPDGYSDKASHWVSTMLWRWNFALAVTSNNISDVNINLTELATAVGGSPISNNANDINIERMFAHFTGRCPMPSESAALTKYWHGSPATTARREGLVGLILACPAFQRC